MKIRSHIKNGEINKALDYININFTEMPLLDLREDPLLLSVKLKCLPIIRHLINKDYHIYCSRDKQVTFLNYIASASYNFELTKLLRDISYSKRELNYALNRASSSCDILTVKILLDAGADFSSKNISPFIDTIYSENTDVASFLIHLLDNIHYIDNDGNTLLHHVAAISHDEELLSYLTFRKVDVNIQNNNGFTALMLSLLSIEVDPESNFIEFGKELITSGTDINIHDNSGNTVLMLACKFNGYTYENDELVDYMKMLIEHGADVNLKNFQNQTALDIAREHRFEEAIKLLEKHVNRKLIIPNLDLKENNNASATLHNYPNSSFLSENGYNAKLSRTKRWEILTREVLTKYPPQMVINKLASFIKRFKSQRNGSIKYADVISVWEYDIERIEEHYRKMN